ncbi:MAG: metal ABC transporter solute-binding protein, Zn/Mn family [bacterium]
MRKPHVFALALFASAGLAADASAADKIKVTCTTSMVGDLIEWIGGERVEVTTLMGPGVDPHLYKASEGDIGRLSSADIVFYNGLFLEGKMQEVLENVRKRGKTVIGLGDRIDKSLLTTPPEFQGHPDPHVWFDVKLWKQTVAPALKGLISIDPASQEFFEANASVRLEELTELHAWCGERLAEIPKERRVLVTAHDAFGYFGRAYDIEVVGLQGISTASEYGLADVQRVVDIVAARGVKAVFVESSVPPRSIEAVVEGCRARGHEVRIGGSLFSDAMGEKGTPQGTYIGMVQHNVTTIVEALK